MPNVELRYQAAKLSVQMVVDILVDCRRWSIFLLLAELNQTDSKHAK